MRELLFILFKTFPYSSQDWRITYKTRWYPRGIQQLVSTYELPETRGGGGGGGPDQLNPKCQDVSKSACSGGLGGGLVVVQNNSTQSVKICPNLHIGGGGGGGGGDIHVLV